MKAVAMEQEMMGDTNVQTAAPPLVFPKRSELHQVLVVDDEAGMRAALESSFLRRGWKVETATGVNDALARFRRHLHPLVISDIRMADGDGFAVMREVRALAPQTGVILLTAFGSVPDAVHAMRDGAFDYLIKPVAFEPLESSARRLLEQALRAGLAACRQSCPAGCRHRRRYFDAGRERHRQRASGADDS